MQRRGMRPAQNEQITSPETLQVKQIQLISKSRIKSFQHNTEKKYR